MTTLEKKSHIEGVPEKKGGKKRVWKVKVNNSKCKSKHTLHLVYSKCKVIHKSMNIFNILFLIRHTRWHRTQCSAYTVISQTRHFEMQKIHNLMFFGWGVHVSCKMLNGLSMCKRNFHS